MLQFEHGAYANGAQRPAGVDEAGRGPLAGPVVAAAVILPYRFDHERLTDSKKLSPARRLVIYEELTTRVDVAWAVGEASVAEIDQLNILRATGRAMQRAVDGLDPAPDHLLVDGRPMRGLTVPQTSIINGDARSFSVAAASVIAKVTRDRLMEQLHARYPQYGFAGHKGYGTSAHRAALARYGPCPVHRRSFAPVRHALELV